MTEKPLPAINGPKGRIASPVRRQDVMKALGMPPGSKLSFSDLQKQAGVTPTTILERGQAVAVYNPAEILEILEFMQRRTRLSWIGEERVVEPYYPTLAGKDLTQPGTILEMEPEIKDQHGRTRRPANGYTIAMENPQG